MLSIVKNVLQPNVEEMSDESGVAAAENATNATDAVVDVDVVTSTVESDVKTTTDDDATQHSTMYVSISHRLSNIQGVTKIISATFTRSLLSYIFYYMVSQKGSWSIVILIVALAFLYHFHSFFYR